MPNYNGVRPSPEDKRIPLHPALLPGTPQVAGWTEIPESMLPEVVNQQCYPTCCAHTYAEAMTVLKYPHEGQPLKFSSGFIYGNSPKISIQGMYPSDADAILINKGTCLAGIYERETVFPAQHTIPQAAYDEALDHRIAHSGVAHSDDEIRAALAAGQPVCMMIEVYRNFERANGLGVITSWGGEFIGYHEVLCYAIHGQGHHKIQNSWGKEWGVNGRIILPKGFPIVERRILTDIQEPTYQNIIIMTVGSKEFIVNGQDREMDTVPVMRNDRVMVPVRFVAEALGAAVEWDEVAQKVTVRLAGNTVEMVMGQAYYRLNGKAMLMDVAPYQDAADRAMVPVRFIAESLGCKVLWEPDRQVVRVLL